MRIAEHAVAIQSSQALQQPAKVADQQQAGLPVMTETEAAGESEKQVREVVQQNKTEGRTIDPQQERKPPEKETSGRRKARAKTTRPVESEQQPATADEEGHIDILV